MLTDSDDGGIDPVQLEQFANHLLAAAGAPDEVAAPVAESLVTADVRGHNSHGVQRIPSYVQSMRGEREGVYSIDASATPTVEAEGPTHAVVDGQCMFGQVVGRAAVDIAVEKASEAGLSIVGIRDATHLGRIGEWSERVADAGFLFNAMVNSQGGRLVALPGSAQPRLGTHPISYGVPTFDALPFPIVLDIATSQVAGGKAMEFAATGDPFPEEWSITRDGGSVADAAALLDGEGAMLPLGGRTAGYKGFGLSIMADLFASTVGDGLLAAQSDSIRGNAAMFVVADPTLFTTRAAVEERVTALAEYIRETEFSPDVLAGTAAYGDEALVPGEPEHRIAARRREHGVPLPARHIEALCDLAIECGIEERIPAAFDSEAAAAD